VEAPGFSPVTWRHLETGFSPGRSSPILHAFLGTEGGEYESCQGKASHLAKNLAFDLVLRQGTTFSRAVKLFIFVIPSRL
jgi:hypothetical protein